MDDVAESKVGRVGDDLVTLLVNAEIDGDRLTRQEIASFFILLCARATRRPAQLSVGGSSC